jgi:hypothetical protein
MRFCNSRTLPGLESLLKNVSFLGPNNGSAVNHYGPSLRANFFKTQFLIAISQLMNLFAARFILLEEDSVQPAARLSRSPVGLVNSSWRRWLHRNPIYHGIRLREWRASAWAGDVDRLLEQFDSHLSPLRTGLG